MVLAFSGNFDWERICSAATESCSQWQTQAVEREVPHSSGSKKKERITKSNLVREHICLMSPAASFQDQSRFAAGLLATIIGDDVGSRYFWELVDKAIAETASMQLGAMDGTGAFYSYIRCSRENVPNVLEIVKNIFDSIANDGITDEELTKAKNKVLSALVIKNELPMGRLDNLGSNWTYLQQYRTIEEDVNAIKTVTVDDVHSLLKQFNPGDFTQLSIGPA